MAKVTEYPRITKMKDNDILLVDGPDGTRTILQADASKQMGGEVIMVNETAGDSTKVVINTTNEDIELATMADLEPVEEDVDELKTHIETIDETVFTGNTEETIYNGDWVELALANESLPFGAILSENKKYRFTLTFSGNPVMLSNVFTATSTSSTGIVDTLSFTGDSWTTGKTAEYIPSTSNIKYLRISQYSAYTGGLSAKIKLEEIEIPKTTSFYSKAQTDARIEDAIDTITEGEESLNIGEVTFEKYIAYSSLEVTNGNSYAYMSDLIEIPSGAVSLSVLMASVSVESAITFYDADSNAISGIQGAQGLSDAGTTYTVSVPYGTKYVRFSGYTAAQVVPETFNYVFEPSINGLQSHDVYCKAKKIDYTAFGDSITSGFGSTGNNNSYASRLDKYFNFKAFSNQGVSGSSVIKQNNNNSILYSKTHSLSNFSGFITLLIGTNDYGNSTGSPLGNVDAIIEENFANLSAPSVTYDASYTFAEGFRYTLEDLRRNNPNSRIIVILPINRNNENTQNSQGCTLDDYREAERKIATAQGCIVIDARECGIPMKQESAYTSDGLHPNDFGYNVLTAFLIPIIENAISTQSYFKSLLT